MNIPAGYSRAQILLHWAIAGLILFNYSDGEGMERAFDARPEGTPIANPEITPGIHVRVGIAVLALCLIRIALRLARGRRCRAARGSCRAPPPAGTGCFTC